MFPKTERPMTWSRPWRPSLLPRLVRMSIVLVLSILALLYHWSRNATTTTRSAVLAAGNSTLGFDSIRLINLRHRYDRIDAAALQAYLSGLRIVEAPGVDANDIVDVGMPPTHAPRVAAKQMGCWRAHANIWNMMLRESIPATLVFEADAAWDVNIRQIMSTLNRHFTQFLGQIGSTPLRHGGWNSGTPTPPGAKRHVEDDADDPWHSQHWDILNIGHCFEYPKNKDISLIYPDPHVPAGMDYYGRILGNERVIRKSGGAVCLTGYAISQTGAAKLLLRAAVDLDGPIDLLIRKMIDSDELVVYSVLPTIVAQWQYAKDIGMEHRGADSDITGKGSAIDSETEMKGWEAVWESASAWKPKFDHPDIAFAEMGLEVAWQRIMGNASLKSLLL